MHKPIRVLYVLHYPTPGGPATSLLTAILRFDKNLVRPFVYAPGFSVAKLFRKSNVPVFVGPVSRMTHFIYYLYKGKDWVVFLFELFLLPFHTLYFIGVLLLTRCDVVHLNEGNLLFSAFIAKAFGKKVVWQIRSLVPMQDKRLRSRLLRWSYMNLADALLAIDSVVFEPLKDIPHVQIVNNPVDVDLFNHAQANSFRLCFDMSPNVICVAMIGRAHPTEGTYEFIGAAERLRDNGYRNIKFIWIWADGLPPNQTIRPIYWLAHMLGFSTGSMEVSAREIVRARKVDEMFVFVPFQSEIASVYKALDIVVTGGQAGLGRQAMEAAAAGKPVIGLSSIADSDLIRDGVTGYVVPVGRPDLLAKRICQLADNPHLRTQMGERGRVWAKERFHPEKVAGKLQDIYLKLCEQTR
jgi:glycosyltransferase involved in cell wall biosynthesis